MNPFIRYSRHRHLDDPWLGPSSFLAKPPHSTRSDRSESAGVLPPTHPNPSESVTDGFENSQARAWVYIHMAMRIGDRHKLSLNSAGAMFSSPHRCRQPPPLLNTGKELCRIRPRTMQADATKSACSIPAISSAQHASIPFVFF